MDLGESLFKGFLNIRKRVQEWLPEAETSGVRLESIAGELRVLRALMTGRLVDLKPVQGAGRNSEECVLLPESIAIARDECANREAYLYRLACSVAVEALNLSAPKTSRGDRLAVSLLAIPMVDTWLEHHFPGLREIRSRLYPIVLDQRRGTLPAIAGTSVLENLTRCLLGEPNSRDGDGSPARTWVADALQLASAGATEMRDAAAQGRLFSALPRFMSRRALESFQLPAVWSEISTAALVKESAERASAVNDQPLGRNAHVVELKKTVVVERDKKIAANNPIFHSFEKTETVEDFSGEQNPAEDAADLRADEVAIKDLSLGHTVRTLEEAKSLVRADTVHDGAAILIGDDTDDTETVARYPEWSFRRGAYLNDWCRVFQSKVHGSEVPASDVQFLRSRSSQVADIRSQFFRLMSLNVRRNRQMEGAEFDLERVVERHADLMAGHTPPDRLYISDRKDLRDIAVLLLFDTSLSTDAWVNDKRILDTERECLLILSAAFEGLLDDNIAVAAFNSRTRLECRYMVLKDFDEPWSALRRSLPQVAPAGYTRIGPAIRHSTQLMKGAAARRKFLLLVTDGKPTDYDQYEGRYGIQDVAQAVREAHQQRIQCFAIAIDDEAKYYLAQMFGAGRYRVLSDASRLTEAMTDVFKKMIW